MITIVQFFVFNILVGEKITNGIFYVILFFNILVYISWKFEINLINK
jgi:hypothetical protein